MRKRTQIKNTNIRLDLMKQEDRKAWDYLHTMNRKNYKSYSRAVVAAVNDFFSRQEKKEEDPYLETRAKEDAFLAKVLDTIREGIREAMPVVAAAEFLRILQAAADTTEHDHSSSVGTAEHPHQEGNHGKNRDASTTEDSLKEEHPDEGTRQL